MRVYYEDTDAGGVVYYANYLKFMERARTEWLRQFGFDQDELSRRQGIVFPVRTVKADYLKPARLDDVVQVSVQVSHQSPTRISFKQEIKKENEVLCRAEIQVVCVSVETFAPKKIPKILTDLLNND